MLLAKNIQQVFDNMCEARELRQFQRSRISFNTMGYAENGVQELQIRGVRFHLHECLFHCIQAFFRFDEERCQHRSTIKIRQIHCSSSSVRSCAGPFHTDACSKLLMVVTPSAI